MNYQIRPIEERDNRAVEAIIRACLIEFGANHEGTAWMDPDLGRFSEIYDKPAHAYWVAEDEQGQVVGGAGIGELAGVEGVCELQKMYCLPIARGTGIAHRLMDAALEFAARHYERCYLETLGNMTAAQKFYKKYGFYRIQEPLGNTGHIQCDVLLVKDLQRPETGEDSMSSDELMFFERMPQFLPLYIVFKQKLSVQYPDIAVKVSKTQISFRNRHIFAVVSLPMRRMKSWPKEYLLVSFGLPYKKESPRIARSAEAYPNRWTHHVPIMREQDIDGELMDWIREAFQFSETK